MKTIGASLVPAAIGLDTSRTRYEAYRQVAYGEKKEISPYVQSLMDFGTQWEATAVAYVEQHTGQQFFFTGDDQFNFSEGRYTCHPDGINQTSTLEVKSRAPGLRPYDVGDDHWRKHMAQVQQAMYVCNRESAYFACWCIDGGSRIWKIQRSENYIAKMHDLLDEFFEFVDGSKACPEKLKRRPKMPSIVYEQIHGPRPPELTDELVASLVFEDAKKLKSLRGLDGLEKRMYELYPDFADAIAKGTETRRAEIRQAKQEKAA